MLFLSFTTSTTPSWWLCVVLLVVVPYQIGHAEILGTFRKDHELQRWVEIKNYSKRPIDIMWISTLANATEENKYVSNTAGGLRYGEETSISSFVAHEFEIWELPRNSTGTCKYNVCRKVFFKVNWEEGQEIQVTPDFKLQRTDDYIKAKQQAKRLIAKCQAQLIREIEPNEAIKDKDLWNVVVTGDLKGISPSQLEQLDNYWMSKMATTLSNNNNHDTVVNGEEDNQAKSPYNVVESFQSCISSEWTIAQDEKQRQIQFESTLRQTLATQLPHYSCHDPTFEDTDEVENRTLSYSPNGTNGSSTTNDGTTEQPTEEYKIQLLHENDSASYIAKAANFLTVQECQVLRDFEAQQAQEKEKEDGEMISTIPWSIMDGESPEAAIVHHIMSKVYHMARLALDWDDLEFSYQRAFDETNLFQVHSSPPPSIDLEEEESSSSSSQCSTTANMDENPNGSEQVCRLSSSSSSIESVSVTDPLVVGRIFFYCHDDDDDDDAYKASTTQGNGGIEFPHAGVHINPKHGMIVCVTFSEIDKADRFTHDYTLCPPQRMYSHTFRKRHLDES